MLVVFYCHKCICIYTVLAQKEKSEALQELVSSHFSPWHLDYSWSEEAKTLREIAVKSPWLIDQQFVLNYFKTLRIVDKNVSWYIWLNSSLYLREWKELSNLTPRTFYMFNCLTIYGIQYTVCKYVCTLATAYTIWASKLKFELRIHLEN